MAHRFNRLSIFGFLVAFIAAPAFAQYSIGGIAIDGAAPYTDAEILQVSGLQRGQMLAEKSLPGTAQNLVNTGVFDDVQVSLSGAGTARTVNIHLKPLPVSSLAGASFTNFVWWTPDELDATLRKRVPLYRGGIPAAGNLPDGITAALTAMLAEKGVHGTVTNGAVQPTNAHPQLTWEFRLDDVPVVLASVNLAGVPAGLGPAMQRVASRAAGTAYNDGISGVTIDDVLLAPLRDAGYQDAKLSDAKREVASTAHGYAVRYSATVIPGDVSHVSSIAWEPTTIYGQDAFAKDAKLHAGDLASQQALLATELAIVDAYLRLGYLDAYVDAHPKEDGAAHSIIYRMQVVPGEIYHLRTVTALNLSPEAQSDFDRGWLLKPGDVYNPLYTASFLRQNTALRKLAGYTAGFQASADPQTHLVDLTIKFVHTGAGQ